MLVVSRFTIADYDRMIAEGKFEGGLNRPRIELIYGELRNMSPIGPPHEEIVDVLNQWSMTNVASRGVRVRIQNSIGIPALDSAPQPDIAWVKEKSYRSARPDGNDVLLIIEVADSSLKYDLGEKAKLYAAAGIAEYWVANIPDRCVEAFREPASGKYSTRDVHRGKDVVHPLAFPGVSLSVASLFGE